MMIMIRFMRLVQGTVMMIMLMIIEHRYRKSTNQPRFILHHDKDHDDHDKDHDEDHDDHNYNQADCVYNYHGVAIMMNLFTIKVLSIEINKETH